MVWQFVLVMIMLAPERRSPNWPGYRKALWLNGPPRKRQWLLVPVLAVALGIEEFVPQIHHAATRELSSFFDSHAGHVFMSGSWGWLRRSSRRCSCSTPCWVRSSCSAGCCCRA